MSWTAPITYTTGMLMTAVIGNQQWRDNELLLATSIETSTGRIAGELKNFREEISSVAFSATPTFDMTAVNNFKFGVLTANVTAITVSGWTASKDQTIKIRFQQDATGGRTVAWPAGWKWSGGVVPVVSSGANKIDVIVLNSDDGGTTIFASFFVNNA